MNTGNQQPGRALLLKALIAALALYYIAAYIFLVVKRLPYPFELEWLEGYFVAAIQRVARGQTLYPAPNAEFVPFLYPPLYYWIAGGLAKLFEPGFAVARALSVFSSFVSGAVIFLFVWRDSAGRFCALMACGLFFACYGITDFWYDVGRVDSLFVALCLTGLYLLRYRVGTAGGAASAALVLALAFFTKQSAIFFIIFGSLFVLRQSRKRFFVFSAASALFVAGGTLLLSLATDGWYWFYTAVVPLKHYGLSPTAFDTSLAEMYRQYTPMALQDYSSLKKLAGFFTNDLLRNIPLPAAVIAGWLCLRLRARDRHDGTLFLGLALLAAMLASISMRCKLGGHINGIMPTLAVAILFFGMVMGRLLQARGTGRLLRSVILIALIAQFVLLKYNPFKHQPAPEDYRAGHRLIETVATLPGLVYIPFHSWYPVMAGKKTFVHKMPIEDIYIGFPERFPTALIEKISAGRFGAIIYDWEIRPESNNPIERAIGQAYRKERSIAYDAPGALLPFSGLRVRPRVIYLPRKN
ncbi:hypothetical protein ACFL43_05990 [Thermodesulfobacteriota bacterium]